MANQKPQGSAGINTARRQWLASGTAAIAAGGLAGLSQTAAAQTAAAAAAPVAAGAKPLPAYVSWKDAQALIVHSTNTIETKRSAFGHSVITPNEQVFVRNNLPTPDAAFVADRDAWVLQVEGVKNPRSLSLKELKSLGLETVTTVLQCSGNGRGFFPSKPSGTGWKTGAAACVVWSGVPVRAIIEALGGMADGMQFITATGGEKLPDGIDPKSVIVERSMPLQAIPDAILAWEMNGAALPLAHGGPLRLIVPGYTGVNNIKYVKRLAFTSEQTDAKIQKHGYRISPPGEKGNPSHPSVWEMSVKSWINSPAPDQAAISAGQTIISGVAMGGVNAVKAVEVSIDGGKTWKAAKFVGPDMGKYAWRQFALAVKLEPGTYTLVSRAIDSKDQAQPEHRVENAGGYNNNSWQDHAVTITVLA